MQSPGKGVEAAVRQLPENIIPLISAILQWLFCSFDLLLPSCYSYFFSHGHTHTHISQFLKMLTSVSGER